ncbi:MAG TPA: PhoH family protein, partial [Wenzhouxiangella sp.]|nr:PhoH family protein [Wenzhouxiangella sp.]
MNANPSSSDILLEPADNKRLANLCGQFDEHLRQIERRLGVEISSRGNSFRVIGDADSVSAAGELLKSLYAQTDQEQLSPARIHLHLQESGVERLLEPPEPPETRVSVRTRRGRIEPRGRNQQEYLRHIEEADITFGVGPAGTGKT